MGEDWSGGEGFLQLIEGSLACIGEVPGGIFLSQPSQGDHNVRVVKYELTIEIHEAKEGLNVLYFSGLRPITNSLDFVFQHCQAIGRKHQGNFDGKIIQGTPWSPSGIHIFWVWQKACAAEGIRAPPECV